MVVGLLSNKDDILVRFIGGTLPSAAENDLI